MRTNKEIALHYLYREFNYLKCIPTFNSYILYRDNFIVFLDLCLDVNLISEDTYSSFYDEILLLDNNFKGV